MKNGVDIELGKTNRLKALRMMEDHARNKQTKTKHENKQANNKQHENKTLAEINSEKKGKKEAQCKQRALYKAANNIKYSSTICSIIYNSHKIGRQS